MTSSATYRSAPATFATGMALALITILLSYAYCYTEKNIAHSLSIVNTATNIGVMFVFRQYLKLKNDRPSVVSVDWFLAISTIYTISIATVNVLTGYNDIRYYELLDVLSIFNFLVYFTYLIITIQIGLRIKRTEIDRDLLQPLGNTFIFLVPCLFIIGFYVISNKQLKQNLALHIILTTITQLPSVLLFLLFYRSRNHQFAINDHQGDF